ncbi:MAG: DUF1801 domain-containing protein [Thermoplasmatota archaeon]
MPRDASVDDWFAAKDHPQEPAMQAVRDVILEDERMGECIKWSTPTFTFNGNLCSFNPAKKFVSLLFHRGAEIPGDHPLLVGDGKLARTARFADVDDVAAKADQLRAVVAAWCEVKA